MQELIQTLIERYERDRPTMDAEDIHGDVAVMIPLSKFISDNLNRIQSIRHCIAEAKTQIRELTDNHEQNISNLARQITDLQNRCPHYTLNHNKVPGNVEWSQCNICGKVL